MTDTSDDDQSMANADNNREEENEIEEVVDNSRLRQRSPNQVVESRQHQRQRITLFTPIDRNLIGTRVMLTEEIKIVDLLNENVENEMNLSKKHIVGQIVRIITPQAGSSGSALTRWQRNNNQQQITFTRIYLCRSHSDLFYIMMTNEMNKHFFHRDLLLRDNGIFTVGSYFKLNAPYPIERNMQGIPLVKSFMPAIVLEVQNNPPSAITVSNDSGVCLLSKAIVTIMRTTPILTTCSGKHCDKQRPLDWAFANNRGCGCWGTTNLGTCNIALMHTVTISHHQAEDGQIRMEGFSSTNFNKLFMDRALPSNTNITMLEQTSASENIEEAIENCLDHINGNGGFDVLFWYSRGEINDQSLVGLNAQGGETQVVAGRTNKHIVFIKPTHRDFYNPTSRLSRRLSDFSFKVGENF